MELSPARAGLVANAALVFAISVDIVLPAIAFIEPRTWFDVLHIHSAPDALHIALLQRAAAQWVAFAVLQIVALARWRRRHEYEWLLLVAGARTSDWLTDLTYLATMPDGSNLRWLLLIPPLLNAGMSLALFLAWRSLTRTPDEI